MICSSSKAENDHKVSWNCYGTSVDRIWSHPRMQRQSSRSVKTPVIMTQINNRIQTSWQKARCVKCTIVTHHSQLFIFNVILIRRNVLVHRQSWTALPCFQHIPASCSQWFLQCEIQSNWPEVKNSKSILIKISSSLKITKEKYKNFSYVHNYKWYQSSASLLNTKITAVITLPPCMHDQSSYFKSFANYHHQHHHHEFKFRSRFASIFLRLWK